MTAETRIALPNHARILVITLRRLGDVLLTTPLIRSIHRAWPEATIDVLVFADTAGILNGNSDLNNIITMPSRPSATQSLILAARLWRRYDLAVSTQRGDRPTFFAIIAGQQCTAPVEEARTIGRFKRAFLQRSVRYEEGVHRVEEMLRLVDALGITREPQVVTPRPRAMDGLPAGDYAVIHAAPFFRYKQWTQEGWRALANHLCGRGLTVMVTGGPARSERHYLDWIWREGNPSVQRCDGVLDWPELTGLLAKARVYVGPDTSVTHLAAAAGCPTVALYGPTDPRLWGPWPAGGLETVWEAAGTLQRRGNVFLVQNPLPCLPCQAEGCERRLDSTSQCLEELAQQRVIAAVDAALVG